MIGLERKSVAELKSEILEYKEKVIKETREKIRDLERRSREIRLKECFKVLEKSIDRMSDEALEKLVENLKNDYIAKVNGVHKSYYKTGGLKSEETYKKEKLNGEYIEYYRTGELKEKGQYLNNQMVGKWIGYTRGGTVREIRIFENNQCKEKTLLKDGSMVVKTEKALNDGNLEINVYYDTGKLKEKKVQNEKEILLYEKYSSTGEKLKL